MMTSNHSLEWALLADGADDVGCVNPKAELPKAFRGSHEEVFIGFHTLDASLDRPGKIVAYLLPFPV